MKLDVKKILLPNLPYVFIFWFFNRVAEGCRLAEGADMVTKAMGAVSGLGTLISKNPLPSFHPRDAEIRPDSKCALTQSLSISRCIVRNVSRRL